MLAGINKLKVDFDNLPKPFLAYFKISNVCNLNCYFCSQNCNNEVNNMSLSKAKMYLKKISDFGVIKIIYTGGEPLLFKELAELMKYGQELGIEQSIVTNGTMVEKLVEIIPYISNIGISLHGGEKIHNQITKNDSSYKTVTKNIILLKNKYNVPVSVNYTFNKFNENEIELSNVKEFCDKYDIKLETARINMIGHAKDFELQDLNNLCSIVEKINKTTNGKKIKFSNCIIPCELTEENKKYAHGCGAGISFFAIENTGDIKICATSDKVLGNLNRQGLKKILNKKNLRNLMFGKYLHFLCKNCKYLLSCRGGCNIEGENRKRINDIYLIKKLEKAKDLVLKNKLLLSTNTAILSKEKVVIPTSPIRIIDKKFFKMLTMLNGNITGAEILGNLPQKLRERALEILITLKLEDLIYAEEI